MFKDIKVGDTVWVESRDFRDKVDVKEMKVEQVGSKYFYTGLGYAQTKFSKVDGIEHTEMNYKDVAYRTKQSLDEKNERVSISGVLYDTFYRGVNKRDLTLDQLRRIKAILDEPK